MQGKSLVEIRSLPQIIGAYDRLSFQTAEKFFSTFVENRCLHVTPCEAELAKLMCNMARYTAFAVANEFYLIADQYQANIHRIFDACGYDYPRFAVPSPGANVSWLCLFKDGFFLAQGFPFPELILNSFKINESMPVHIFKKIQLHREIRKVGVLGLTFKSGSDDTRYSLSFKLKKLIESAGYEAACIDPHLPKYKDFSRLRGCDAVVLMTPHAEFTNLNSLAEIVDNGRCLYVDIWGLPSMRGKSANGCFSAEKIRATAAKRQTMPKSSRSLLDEALFCGSEGTILRKRFRICLLRDTMSPASTRARNGASAQRRDYSLRWRLHRPKCHAAAHARRRRRNPRRCHSLRRSRLSRTRRRNSH